MIAEKIRQLITYPNDVRSFRKNCTRLGLKCIISEHAKNILGLVEPNIYYIENTKRRQIDFTGPRNKFLGYFAAI